MDTPTVNLPPITSLPSSVITFLQTTFNQNQQLDISESTRLVTELDAHCSELTHLLSDLTRRLDSSLLSYASFSDLIRSGFDHIHSQLHDLVSDSSSFSSSSDGKGEQMVSEELPSLAKEVARVEMVRNYAETTLKLDSLVGEIEDTVSSLMNNSLKTHSKTQSTEELHFLAISSLKLIEDILASVTKAHPQWVRLVSSADHRVDRALATLRPQAVADHRALLTSLGWPPPLSSMSSPNLDTRTSETSNPLSAMHGELKHKYCKNFFALCSLQELQRRRRSRQLEGYNRNIALHQPLWAIEELVNPLSLASHKHFKKWVDKPEFIFALVYKIIRDYIDSVDELLQPLVDEAMLIGYSCREEWISGVVTSLSTYLAKEIFPVYVSQLNEKSDIEVQLQTKISWLHLVDLMMSFDKRIQVLASHSGILVSAEDYGLLQRISSLSVFCDRPDWLNVWAEIELGNMLDKLKPELEDERNWTIKTQGAVLVLGSEDYKSPLVSSLFLRHVSSIIDRCRSLPTVFLRSRFIRLVGKPIFHTLLDFLLTKCLVAEGYTALVNDDDLARVLTCINTAHHIESVLKEWCEDVFFLEMGLEDGDDSDKPFDENILFTGVTEGVGSGVFDNEIEKIEEFRKEWVDKIKNMVLRGFDAQSCDYVRNKKQWQENVEDGWSITKSFVVALDFLQGKMSILEVGLNSMDFTVVWRSLASGIDRLLFNAILMSNAKFHGGGVKRFGGDLDVLFGVFRTWCLRPEGFFPRLSEGIKLLKMDENHIKNLSKQGEEWLKHNGFRHLNLTEAEKIARCRVFQ